MSVGPMGMAGGVAGSPLAQGAGSEVDRTQQESAAQSRQTRAAEKAEEAAGIGETEQDEEASDRDADGRRLWEDVPENPNQDEESLGKHHGKDPTGQLGGQLDLNG